MSALNHFTPVTAAIGGIMLGLSSSALLHQTGRWSGASSIYRRATTEPLGSWRQTWVAGCMGAIVVARILNVDFLTQYLGANADNADNASLTEVILGAVLIGFGTRVGCGCTSGHGVMGIPRMSMRSIIATGSFMTTGVLAATFLRPMLFADQNFPGEGASVTLPGNVRGVINIALVAAAAACLVIDLKRHARAAITTFGCGLAFGLGLLISGMVEAEKIRGFLDVRPLFDSEAAGSWDPSMIVVMASAVATNFLTFNFWLLPKGTQHHDGQEAAIEGHKFCLPTKTKLTTALVVGSAIFGVGWGLSGICVGPAIANAAKGGITSIIALAGISAGSYLSRFIDPLFG